MQDLNDKVTTGTLTAAEWNEMPSELQNVITQLGIALSGGDFDQVGKAIAGYVGAGDFYTETGVANAYIASVIGGKQGPKVPLVAVHDGLQVRFRPGNTNTGASTINVNGHGIVPLTKEDGTALVAGDLLTVRDAICRYDQTADDFRLLDYAATPTVDFTIDSFSGHFVDVFADTITLEQSAAFAYDIDTLIAITSVGSVNVTISINGTPVTGMSAVTVNTTEDTLTATALNSVAVGDTVTMVLATLVGNPADLAWTFKATRT